MGRREEGRKEEGGRESRIPIALQSIRCPDIKPITPGFQLPKAAPNPEEIPTVINLRSSDWEMMGVCDPACDVLMSPPSP